MYQHCVLICYVGALIFHVPSMQLSLEALTLVGLGASKEYLLVLDLHVLYISHA